MRCKKIQDLIITDYLDGRSTPEAKKRIDAHLSRCAGCQEFLEAAGKIVIEPFEGAPREQAPDAVWNNVAAMIQEEQQSAYSDPAYPVWERLKSMIQPKPALASVLAIFLMALVLSRTIPYQNQNDYVQQASRETIYTNESDETHEAYVVSVMGYSDESDEEEGYSGYGTHIEELFLQS